MKSNEKSKTKKKQPMKVGSKGNRNSVVRLQNKETDDLNEALKMLYGPGAVKCVGCDL